MSAKFVADWYHVLYFVRWPGVYINFWEPPRRHKISLLFPFHFFSFVRTSSFHITAKMPFYTASKSTFEVGGQEFPRISWWKEPGMRGLYVCLMFAVLTSATTGYDGSMMNDLQALDQWANCKCYLSDSARLVTYKSCSSISQPKRSHSRPPECHHVRWKHSCLADCSLHRRYFWKTSWHHHGLHPHDHRCCTSVHGHQHSDVYCGSFLDWLRSGHCPWFGTTVDCRACSSPASCYLHHNL
jgi:hypothetical protein